MGITYNITEPEFQRNETSACQLSILVGMDSLVYSVYGLEANRLLVVRSCPIEPSNDRAGAVIKAIEKEDLLGPLYRRVKIGLNVPQVALVPTRLFSEQNKATYLQDLTSIEEDQNIYVDEIEDLRLKIVYQVENPEAAALKSRFPTCKIYNASTAYIAGCHAHFPNGGNEVVYAFFEKDHFRVAVFDRGELLFYNSFDYQSANDVLYFMLLTLEQYGLNPLDVPLYLMGQVVEESEIYKLLYRYISSITFLSAPHFIQVGKSGETVNQSFLFHLHSLLLCK